ncbi:hypothetical protein D9M71_782690 [compost metagenome]
MGMGAACVAVVNINFGELFSDTCIMMMSRCLFFLPIMLTFMVMHLGFTTAMLVATAARS